MMYSERRGIFNMSGKVKTYNVLEKPKKYNYMWGIDFIEPNNMDLNEDEINRIFEVMMAMKEIYKIF